MNHLSTVLTLAFSILAGRASEHMEPVSCVLTSNRPSYAVGEAPDLAVRIVNNAGLPVDLPGSLDGSEYKWRYPHTYFTVVRPSGPVPVDLAVRCGNTNALRAQDFVRVEPGAGFDPFMKVDDGGFRPSQLLGALTFEQPGDYLFTFHYSTEATELAAWQGTPVCVDCPTAPPILSLVERVPKVSVACSLRVSVGAWKPTR